MRSPTLNKKLPSDMAAQLKQLREQVRHAEDHGQFDTCHHVMFAQLCSRLGLIPGKKETRTTKDEVNNGESNL